MTPAMKIAAFALAALGTAGTARTARAQLHPIEQGNKGPAISTRSRFPNIVHHEAEVKAVFTSVPAGPLHARMARSSTARYALHEFAKNVYSLKAVDSRGRELAVTRPDPYGWDVTRPRRHGDDHATRSLPTAPTARIRDSTRRRRTSSRRERSCTRADSRRARCA